MSDTTPHTCTDTGKPMPFGRKAPYGACARCDELHDGAPARKPAWVAAKERASQDDQRRAADIRAHFRSRQHLSGGCGPVCTYGDW